MGADLSIPCAPRAGLTREVSRERRSKPTSLGSITGLSLRHRQIHPFAWIVPRAELDYTIGAQPHPESPRAPNYRKTRAALFAYHRFHRLSENRLSTHTRVDPATRHEATRVVQLRE